ncbi:MAG: ribosome biogenesis GTPase YlqF [Oscillospiraceae bacterium]|jgi:ribosome biogenesis GTPase A|nr:ribosome biogenesis GTPase YlqF [Oscillospiraceae bacterium]
MADIQWFPGHMKKAERLIQANLSLVDGIVELIDARVPFSSRSVYLEKFLKKPKLILLNKSDLADPAVTKLWMSYFEKQKIPCLEISSKNGKGTEKFLPFLREKVLKDLVQRRAEKGMLQPLRVMVVGIPNVGKSAFINRITKKKLAKVEDRPGVTRQKQWLKLDKDAELLDMPGVLAPKYENQTVAGHLAFIGSINDDILDIENLAFELLKVLKKNYPSSLIERYKIEISDEDDSIILLNKIGQKRGMLISGGEVNTERTAIMLLDEFRSGKLGRISLEKPL